MNNDSSSWKISFGVSEGGCFSQAGARNAEVLILRNKDKDFDGQLRLSIAAWKKRLGKA